MSDDEIRSRRSILAAAVGAVAAFAASALGRPLTVNAANGSPVLLGKTSYATNSTIVSTTLGNGLYGKCSSTSGRGVRGDATATSGTGSGVYGVAASTSGRGVYGNATKTSGTAYGVYGTTASTAGIGAYGYATATSGTPYGVYGQTRAPSGYGVYGKNSASTGAGPAVYGTSTASPDGQGVQGHGNRVGVGGYTLGMTTASVGVYGQAPQYSAGYALYGSGNGAVTGGFSKAGGSFKIDHPLDPANRYLRHSFVESPDMMNVYAGNATLDAKGEATIELPAWFEALNRDLRYQLTAVGAPAPDLHVKAKVKDKRFAIAGGRPGQEVSWQITGIRQDAWANAHRIPVEEPKAGEEKGRYLHPAEHGQPEANGIPHPVAAA